jgi:hypothetical protein
MWRTSDDLRTVSRTADWLRWQFVLINCRHGLKKDRLVWWRSGRSDEWNQRHKIARQPTTDQRPLYRLACRVASRRVFDYTRTQQTVTVSVGRTWRDAVRPTVVAPSLPVTTCSHVFWLAAAAAWHSCWPKTEMCFGASEPADWKQQRCRLDKV